MLAAYDTKALQPICEEPAPEVQFRFGSRVVYEEDYIKNIAKFCGKYLIRKNNNTEACQKFELLVLNILHGKFDDTNKFPETFGCDLGFSYGDKSFFNFLSRRIVQVIFDIFCINEQIPSNNLSILYKNLLHFCSRMRFAIASLSMTEKADQFGLSVSCEIHELWDHFFSNKQLMFLTEWLVRKQANKTDKMIFSDNGMILVTKHGAKFGSDIVYFNRVFCAAAEVRATRTEEKLNAFVSSLITYIWQANRNTPFARGSAAIFEWVTAGLCEFSGCNFSKQDDIKFEKNCHLMQIRNLVYKFPKINRKIFVKNMKFYEEVGEVNNRFLSLFLGRADIVALFTDYEQFTKIYRPKVTLMPIIPLMCFGRDFDVFRFCDASQDV